MTDGEPEPFRMSTEPDDDPEVVEADDELEVLAADDESSMADDDADQPDGADGDDTDDAPILPGVESIADLIDEVSRTAAEQAVQSAMGTAPVDRSAEVWGPAEDDVEDVWSAAASQNSGSRVFDDVLGTDDAWGSTQDPQVSPAADPLVDVGGAADDAEEEPEVYTFAVADDQSDGLVAADDLTASLVVPTDEPSTRTDEPADDDADEDDTFAVLDEVIEADDGWADQAWSDQVDAADEADDDVETPEPFRFAAGPATTAPAPVPDHVDAADEREPDTFSFAFDSPGADDAPAEEPPAMTDDPWSTADDEPAGSADAAMSEDDAGALWAGDEPAADTDAVWAGTDPTDAGPVWEDEDGAAADDAVWAASSADAGDIDMAVDDAGQDDVGSVDDEAWTFDVTDEAADDGEDDAAWTFDVGDDDEAGGTLAETVVPRADTGWNDLEEEQATWTMPTAPAANAAGDDEPDGFVMAVDDAPVDDADASFDDGPVVFPAADEPAEDEPVAPAPSAETDVHAATEDLHGALGDLLGGTIGGPGLAPVDDDDPFADFDDLDDVLSDLDGLDDMDDVGTAAPPVETPSFRDAPPPALADAPPPTLPDAPPPAVADAAAPPDDAVDEQDEEATPVVPAPGSMTTFSAKKAKKRGLFG